MPSLRELRRVQGRIRADTLRRDELIRAARADGESLRVIAEAAGLSPQRVQQITGRRSQ